MRPAVDLEKALVDSLDRHLAPPRLPQAPPNLAEAIRYSLLAPGKRIRPRLSLACAHMLGVPLEATLPAALSIEMVHCFTLIHDDLPCMDDDDFRRGRLSNHKKFGEALALLAGDALMMLALDTLCDAQAHVPGQAFAQAVRRFAWASGARGVIGGQAAEARLTTSSPLSDLDQMHAMKTGALFAAALLLPMDLASISEHSPQGMAITRFASALGAAFQTADDLEDSGKESGGDAAGDPTNILSHLSEDEARSRAQSRLNEAVAGLKERWGEPATELVHVAQEVYGHLQRSGRS